MWNLGGVAEAVSRVALALQSAPEGLPQRIWEQLGPWTQRLLVNSTEKWLPRLMVDTVCEVPIYRGGKAAGPCHNHGLTQCMVCQRVCCLDHCLIDQHAAAMCYMCALGTLQSARATATANGQMPPGPLPWEQGARGGNGAGRQAEVDRAALRAACRLLNVRMDASEDEIKMALRHQLGKWHPDRHRGEKAKEHAEQRFKEVQMAYDVVMRARAQKQGA